MLNGDITSLADYSDVSQGLEEKESFWQNVFQGDLQSLTPEVNEQLGTDDSLESDDENIAKKILQSWMVDSLGKNPAQVRQSWGEMKESLAQGVGGSDLSHYEIYQSLSLQHQVKAQQWEDLRQDYQQHYLDVLSDEQTELPKLSDGSIRAELRSNVLREAREEALSHRKRLKDDYEVIKSGLDTMVLYNPITNTIKKGLITGLTTGAMMMRQSPGVLKAGQRFGSLSQEDQDLVLTMLRGAKGRSSEYWDALAQSFDRGVQNVGYRLGQLGLNSLAWAGSSFDWGEKVDLTAQGLNKLRQFALNEYSPLSVKGDDSRWKRLSLDVAQEGASSLLGFCGIGGITALLASDVGEQMAQARSRNPQGNFSLQMGGAVGSGAVNTALSVGMNHLGQKLLHRSISGFRASKPSSWFKEGSKALGELGLMTAENKLQSLAPELIHGGVSVLDGQDFGDGVSTWADSQMDTDHHLYEAGMMMPYFLIAGGKLALNHFRSPYQFLNSGKEIKAFGVEQAKVDQILHEKDLNKASELLKDALRQSPLWGSLYVPRRALDWSHLLDEKGQPFLRDTQDACDFLQLKSDVLTKEWNESELPASYHEWKGGLAQEKESAFIRSRWMKRAMLPDFSESLLTPDQMTAQSGTRTSTNDLLTQWDVYVKEREEQNLSMAQFQGHEGLPARLFESAFDHEAEPLRREFLNHRLEGLQARPYRMLLLSYPTEIMSKQASDLKSWDHVTTDFSLKNKAVIFDGVMDMVYGKDHSLVSKETSNRLWSMVLGDAQNESDNLHYWSRELSRDAESPHLENSDVLSMLHEQSLTLMHDVQARRDISSEILKNMHREIWGGMADVNSLYHLFANMGEFDTYMSRGLSPDAIYSAMLTKHLDVTMDELQPYLRGEYSKIASEGMDLLSKSSVMSDVMSRMEEVGYQFLESTKNSDGEILWRAKYPNGQLSSWHDSIDHAKADLMGHLSLIYSPVGLTKTSQMHDWRDFPVMNNFISLRFRGYEPNSWGDVPRSGFDQLGRQALCDLVDNGFGRLSQGMPNTQLTIESGGRRLAQDIMSANDLRQREEVFNTYVGNHEALGIDASNREIDTASGVVAHDLSLYNTLNPLALIEDKAEVLWDRLLRTRQLDRDVALGFLTKQGRLSASDKISHSRLIEELSQISKEYYAAHLEDATVPQSVRNWFQYALGDPHGENEVHRLWKARDQDWGNMQAMIQESVGMNPMIRSERSWGNMFAQGSGAWQMPMMERYMHRVMDGSLMDYVPESLRISLEFVLGEGNKFFSSTNQQAKKANERLTELSEVLREHPDLIHLRQSVDNDQLVLVMQEKALQKDSPQSIWQQVSLKDLKEPSMLNDLNLDRVSIHSLSLLEDKKVARAFESLSLIRKIFEKRPAPTMEGVVWEGKRYHYSEQATPKGVPETWVKDVPLSGVFEATYMLLENQKPLKKAQMPYISDPEWSFNEMASGVIYRHPDRQNESVRLMPGLPENPLTQARSPYVVHQVDGIYLNKDGKAAQTLADSYIPLEDFHTVYSLNFKATPDDVIRQNQFMEDIRQTLSQTEWQDKRWWGENAESCMFEDMIRLYEESGIKGKLSDGTWKLTDPRVVQTLRMASHVINSPMLLRLPDDNHSRTHDIMLKEGALLRSLFEDEANSRKGDQ